jgi:hypothetical protein
VQIYLHPRGPTSPTGIDDSLSLPLYYLLLYNPAPEFIHKKINKKVGVPVFPMQVGQQKLHVVNVGITNEGGFLILRDPLQPGWKCAKTNSEC